jgi:hypothetical protein
MRKGKWSHGWQQGRWRWRFGNKRVKNQWQKDKQNAGEASEVA